MLKTYIHYGSSVYDKNRFMPVCNCPWNKPKPHTCLWGSPTDSQNSWKNFCVSENFRTNSLREHFTFRLVHPERILFIHDEKSLGILKQYTKNGFYIDFEKIYADGYSGIEVSITDFGILTPHILLSWDVDSIVMFDKDEIIQV